MNTFRELAGTVTVVAAEQPRVTSFPDQAPRKAVPAMSSLHDEQIEALVQQLFFRHESAPVRHVAFAPVEPSAKTATLCLDVARTLAEEGRYDVGLIDAHSDSVVLQTQLQIPSPSHALPTSSIGPRLWMVPRQSWLGDESLKRITDQNLSKLREISAEFDFSILWCAPVSWLTASIGQSCDGVVLVLTANKTRRLVAAPARTPIQQLLPHPTGDRFMLFQLVAADLIVVAVVCSTVSLFFSPGSLPWTYLPIFGVLVTLFGFSEGLYKSGEDPYPDGIALVLMRSSLFATGLVFIAARDQMGPSAAFAIFTGSVAGLVLWRRFKQVTWKRRRRETEGSKILIIGGGPVGHSIARALRSDPIRRAIVCGFVDNDLPLSPMVLGRIADLDWLARAEFIDEVILALPGQPAQMREAAEAAFRNHLDIRAVPDLPPGPWPDSGIDLIGEVPVVTLHRESLPNAALFLKRLLDVTGSAFSLVLASPLMAIVALLIRLDSPGPIVYSAERTGVKGRRFRCYKFRSMVTDADDRKEELRDRNQREGPIFKLDNDPRVTRIGRIIRRYSLDELPQLWNVLCGDMSLVGPRPHPVDEVNHYELHHYRRLDVKPGITGLWQITARKCSSFELNMHLDLTYIENWSLRLDMRILAGTVRVLFAPEGA